MQHDDGQVVHVLIQALKDTVPIQVRVGGEAEPYLEGVVLDQDVARCVKVLEDTLGAPAKPFHEAARVDRAIRRAVDRLGGIREEQCLFMKALANDTLAYAMLWPWASDPTRVTLKVGTTKK